MGTKFSFNRKKNKQPKSIHDVRNYREREKKRGGREKKRGRERERGEWGIILLYTLIKINC